MEDRWEVSARFGSRENKVLWYLQPAGQLGSFLGCPGIRRKEHLMTSLQPLPHLTLEKFKERSVLVNYCKRKILEIEYNDGFLLI